MKKIETTFLRAITESAWVSNIPLLEIQIQGLSKVPHLQYVVLDLQGRPSLTAGEPADQFFRTEEFPLQYSFRNKNIRLGTLRIHFSSQHADESYAVKFLYIFIVQTCTVFLVSILIFYLFYNLVGRHLYKIAKHTDNISLNNLDEPLVLDAPYHNKDQDDELSRLVNSINYMLKNLHSEVTERKRAEEALRRSQLFNETILNASPDIIYIYDIIEKKNIYSNEGMATVLGYSTSEVKEMGARLIESLMHPDDFQIYLNEILPQYQAGKENGFIEQQYRMRHKNGQWRWLASKESIFLRKEDGEPRQIFGILTDITNRKRTEEKLKEINTIFQTLLENSPIYIFFKDHEIRPIYLSRNYEQMLGMPLEKVIGKTMDELFPSALAKSMIADDKKIIDEGQLIQIDESFNERHYTTIKFPITLAGKPPILAGFTLDITDRKQAEEEKVRLMEQLLQSQKMEAVGTLAGGIAHDFNNMLGVIVGNISHALSILEKDDALYEILSDIQEGAQKSQMLTQQLLTFSKGGKPIRKTADLNELVTESAKFVTRGANSKCLFSMADDLWVAEVDKGQIHQVISNLVINANQAMPAGGVIRIMTENIKIEAQSGIPLPEGRYIKITVEDQGVGISNQHLANIFDPFFTTKQKGSGLGLATAYSVIKKHDGHIAVFSELDEGTVFHVYLPASEKSFPEIENTVDATHQGAGKILIMDDEASILKMVGMMLNSMGYETVLTSDGSQAIELYRKNFASGDPFDLVILDLTVPGGLGGAKTVLEMLKIDPNVKAVVSSGYSNDPIMGNFEDYGFCGVIPKPFTRGQLSDLLNKVFEKRV